MIPKSRLKALWLASWFPHRGQPLYGNFVAKQAQALARLCDIAVVFAIEETGLNKTEIVVSQGDYLSVIVYFPKSKWRFINTFRYLLAMRKGLLALKKHAFDPNIVHLHVVNRPSIFALYYHFFKNIPFVITEHLSKINERDPLSISPLQRLIFSQISRRAKCIIGISHHFVESMRQAGFRGHFQVIPNIVDVNLFSPPIQLPNTPPTDAFKLLHVSSLLENHKNIAGILRGVHLLAQMRRDFSVTFVGPHERHAAIIELSKKLNINHLISIKNSMRAEEIAIEMQNSHVFVMLSNREGLPVVLLEALAVGLPVVVSETGGIAEWVNAEKGRVVAIGDEEAFAIAIDEVLNKYNSFSPEIIRNQVVEKCANERVSNEILSVYRHANPRYLN